MITSIERQTMKKVYLRLLPFCFVLYFICYLDRVNIGFAALTMNKDLGELLLHLCIWRSSSIKAWTTSSMPASTAKPSASARGAPRLRPAGDDRLDQHSGLNLSRHQSFIRADLTTLLRSYSPSLDRIPWQPISAAMRADAARRWIMRQAPAGSWAGRAAYCHCGYARCGT